MMILEGYDRVSHVAGGADAPEALAIMGGFRADLVLLDISLPGMDGIKLLREFRARYPQTKVLMLSSSNRAIDIGRAFAEGAAGYCYKDQNIDESLHRALRSLCAGQYWVDSNIAKQLGDQKLFSDTETALLRELAAERSDVSNTMNQEIMAGIVDKMRKKFAA